MGLGEGQVLGGKRDGCVSGLGGDFGLMRERVFVFFSCGKGRRLFLVSVDELLLMMAQGWKVASLIYCWRIADRDNLHIPGQHFAGMIVMPPFMFVCRYGVLNTHIYYNVSALSGRPRTLQPAAT
jgi:hypothetical protein